MAGFKFLWVSLALSLVSKSLATEDVEVSFDKLTYLPSRNDWFDYSFNPNAVGGVNCAHTASNTTGAAVTYTFTGTAIKLYIPKVGNGANVRITFSDSDSVWDYNSNSAVGQCGTFQNFDFPQGQYKRLTVRMEPTDGQYLNIEKLVVTQLTDAELQALRAQSEAPVSIQSTQSLASIASVNSMNALASQSVLSVQSLSSIQRQPGVQTPFPTQTSLQIDSTGSVQTTQTQVTQVINVPTTIGTSVGTVPITTSFPSNIVLGGTQDMDFDDPKSNIGPIVGSVVGALVGTVVLGSMLTCIWKRKNKRASIHSIESSTSLVAPKGRTSLTSPTSGMAYSKQYLSPSSQSLDHSTPRPFIQQQVMQSSLNQGLQGSAEQQPLVLVTVPRNATTNVLWTKT